MFRRQNHFACLPYSLFAISVFMFTSAAELPANQPKDDASELIEKVEKELRTELMSAVRSNSVLSGTWIELALKWDDKTGRVTGCTIDAVLDQDSTVEKLQRNEIDRIVKKFLPNYQYVVKDVGRLPINRVITNLRSQIDMNPRLAGAAIASAYFNEYTQVDRGQWTMTLELSGRVVNEEHRAALTEMANKLLQSENRDPAFRILAVADKLRVARMKSGGPTAGFCFNQGLQSFSKRDYAAAYRFFSEAAREAPDRIEYQYWRVAALLGNCRKEDATTLLENLVQLRIETTKSSVMESVVAQSLERVQGPIRQQMAEIEKQAMCPNCE